MGLVEFHQISRVSEKGREGLQERAPTLPPVEPVCRYCITTSSGIMSLMRVGL